MGRHEKLKEFMNPCLSDYEHTCQVFAGYPWSHTDDFLSHNSGFNDPREVDIEETRRCREERVQLVVDFVNVWKEYLSHPRLETRVPRSAAGTIPEGEGCKLLYL